MAKESPAQRAARESREKAEQKAAAQEEAQARDPNGDAPVDEKPAEGGSQAGAQEGVTSPLDAGGNTPAQGANEEASRQEAEAAAANLQRSQQGAGEMADRQQQEIDRRVAEGQLNPEQLAQAIKRNEPVAPAQPGEQPQVARAGAVEESRGGISVVNRDPVPLRIRTERLMPDGTWQKDTQVSLQQGDLTSLALTGRDRRIIIDSIDFEV